MKLSDGILPLSHSLVNLTINSIIIHIVIW